MPNNSPSEVDCPTCGGSGWVYREGTTEPYGDDPDADVRCPTCNRRSEWGHAGKVTRAWSDAHEGETGRCDCCGYGDAPVARLHDEDGFPADYCAQCGREIEVALAKSRAA